jgi:hypothetical protein
MALPWYATREAIAGALDFKESSRSFASLDRAAAGASRSIDALCHRVFYPVVGTRYFRWPDRQSPTGWRLWLDENGLVDVTSITSGGVALAPDDYYLEPVDSGPPYDRIEINRSGSANFNTGLTPQRDVAITGTWCGAPLDSTPAGTLVNPISDTVTTTMQLSNAAVAGVGDLLTIDSERVVVTAKAAVSTGQTVAAPGITAASADSTLPTGSSSTANIGEVILVDAERMLVQDKIGSSLIVRRAWDGTALAAHSAGVTVYAPRTCTVARGQLGTMAATHAASAPVSKFLVPALVGQLAVGEAVASFLQEAAGMARTSGGGDNEFEIAAKGLIGLRKQVYRAHGRKSRKLAV